MVMQTLQIRLTPELINEVQMLIEWGLYGSVSEAVRDAVRRLVTGVEKPIKAPEGKKEDAKKAMEKVEEEVKKQFQRPKGTVDFYPEDKAVQLAIFGRLREAALRYNFKEVEGPVFENLSLLSKKEGEEIKSQIFVLEKKGEEEFGLRFDLTVPNARMFIAKQKSLAKPVKWFNLSRMWRYEAPQKGRLREFYQLNCEIYGSAKAEADAEVISLAIDALKSLGLTEKDFFVKLNNRYLLEGLLLDFVDKEKIGELLKVIDKKNKITEAEFDSELKKIGVGANITQIKSVIALRELDSIGNQVSNDTAKRGFEELSAVLKLLKEKKDFIRVDLSVARGLAYYTGTVFESYDIDEKYRALAGGGRYDEMIGMFKGQPCHATGFGLGYATVYLLLEEKGLLPRVDLSPDYFIAIVNEDVKEEAVELCNKLRKKYKVEMDIMERNLGNQLKFADAIKAKKVVIVGPDELKKNKVKVKDMESGKEEEVLVGELG